MKLIFSTFITLFLASNTFAVEVTSTTPQDGNAIHYFTKYVPGQLVKDRVVLRKETDATKKAALKETFDKNVSGYSGEIKLQQDQLNAVISNPASTKKDVKKAKKNLKALNKALEKISKQQLLANAETARFNAKGKAKIKAPEQILEKSPSTSTGTNTESSGTNANQNAESTTSSGTR